MNMENLLHHRGTEAQRYSGNPTSGQLGHHPKAGFLNVPIAMFFLCVSVSLW